MVAPERQPLTEEVEVDEGFLGGRDTDLRGGRQRNGKPLVGVAVEVRGKGSGRLRLRLLPDASAASLTRFVSSSAHAIDKERSPSELSCRSGETTLAQATLFEADGAANEERQQGAMDCALHRLRREWSRHAGTRGPTQFRIKPVVQSTATFADRGATIRPATNTSSDTV